MRTTDPRALGTILSIWAHPDDESYLAGGLMASAAAAGGRVVCVSATAGERGTDDPIRWPADRLGPVRRHEAAAAMAVLGVADHRFLGMPDGALADLDAAGTRLVGDLLDDVRPDTIVTFGPDGITGHADHVAVHRWVVEAWRARGCRVRLLHPTWTVEHLARFAADLEADGVHMTDDRPVGVPEADLAVRVRLDGADLDRKVVALRAMATQTAAVVARRGVERFARSVAEECFVDYVAPGGSSPR